MDRIERLIILAIVALTILTAWSIITAVQAQQPYENPVCRNEFGHRIECDE